MRKFLSSVGIVALLAFGLAFGGTVAKSVAAPQVVGACSVYTHEAWGGVGTTGFVSTYIGGEDYLHIQIETLKNDCGYRFYKFRMWTSYGTPLTYQIRGRIWVCGNLAANIVVNNSAFDTSGWGPYGGCGRQADTWYSYDAWGGGTYDANGTTYVYATA